MLEEVSAEGLQGAIVDWTKFSAARNALGGNFVRILGYFREDAEKAIGRIEEAMHGRDAAALVLPAHTMKSEARQFGADPLGQLAEDIENAARRAVESHIFPDEMIPEVARLRPLYAQTMALFEKESNPLVARRPVFGRAASNQNFGRL